jgi:hypothetical protein
MNVPNVVPNVVEMRKVVQRKSRTEPPKKGSLSIIYLIIQLSPSYVELTPTNSGST